VSSTGCLACLPGHGDGTGQGVADFMSQLVPAGNERLLRDRFRGVILGSAIGDALGGPLEFQPPPSPDALVTDMIGGGWQQLEPGEWTDDTHMSLCVAESLLAKKVFDPDDIAARFVGWMQSQPKDIGIHTQRILQQIADGGKWDSVSYADYIADPQNASNGSIMRCAPLSLFMCHHIEYLTDLSPVLSQITHAHPECQWSCVFLNILIASLLVCGRVIDAVEMAYESIAGCPPTLAERIGTAMSSECRIEPSGYVLDTLEVALWVFLHTEDFESALVTAINRGGDTDSVGAVTGALAGAWYGASRIPDRWIRDVQNPERLIVCADGLYELAAKAI